MNFNCNKSELFGAISHVSKAVPTKSSIPQLEGIKLSLSGNTLTLTGYDLEMGITTTVNVANLDSSSGEYIINARLFADMVRKMPSDVVSVNVNQNDNMKAQIKSGNTNCKMAVLSAKDYPNFPDTSTGEVINVPQKTLKDMVNQTIYAVSVSDIKPVLTGELFDITSNGEFNLVAIDGKRLAVRHEKIAFNQDIKFVVPAKTLSELTKLLSDDVTKECKIVSTGRHITFQVDDYTIVSRLLEGEFHNYRASIPKEFKSTVTVKTQELIDCLERCSLLINDKNRAPIKLHFAEDTLKIVCETPLGNIDEEIAVQITSDNPLLIGLNNKFLLDALRATDCDEVEFKINSPISPIIVKPPQGSETFTFLLMPIQLKENAL